MLKRRWAKQKALLRQGFGGRGRGRREKAKGNSRENSTWPRWLAAYRLRLKAYGLQLAAGICLNDTLMPASTFNLKL
ncbi:hypothetical protein SAMN05660816_02645 [Niastella yeongjuensis]|nr:hypothetical protein SAMN05660816_02645 [Niastella yeongjuensis]